MSKDKGGNDMEKLRNEDGIFNKDIETRVKVKDGCILLDRNNPIHRMWMEEDEE